MRKIAIAFGHGSLLYLILSIFLLTERLFAVHYSLGSQSTFYGCNRKAINILRDKSIPSSKVASLSNHKTFSLGAYGHKITITGRAPPMHIESVMQCSNLIINYLRALISCLYGNPSFLSILTVWLVLCAIKKTGTIESFEVVVGWIQGYFLTL